MDPSENSQNNEDKNQKSTTGKKKSMPGRPSKGTFTGNVKKKRVTLQESQISQEDSEELMERKIRESYLKMKLDDERRKMIAKRNKRKRRKCWCSRSKEEKELFKQKKALRIYNEETCGEACLNYFLEIFFVSNVTENTFL